MGPLEAYIKGCFRTISKAILHAIRKVVLKIRWKAIVLMGILPSPPATHKETYAHQ